MPRLMLVLATCLALSACGLGETAVSATAGAAGAAQEAKEGLEAEARVQQQLDAAAALDRQRREDAEAGAK